MGYLHFKGPFMLFEICAKCFSFICLLLESQFFVARAKWAKRGGDHRVGLLQLGRKEA
jgi:hypothetical protein